MSLVLLAWQTCFPANKEALERFKDVSRRYQEPHRHYHTMDHIGEVLRWVMTLQPPEVETMLAAVLHDIIYDPRASNNEERSAEYARELLQSLGAGARVREQTARLILLTKSHETTPDDALGHILLDADLAILSANPEDYNNYSAAIRREYDWVPEREYRMGRRGVLERFLARSNIYHTEQMRAREPRARANLAREIASLS